MRMWPLELVAALWLGCAAGAEAQTVELGLDAAADHTVIYPLMTVPANIRQFVAIITYGAATPKKIHAEFVAIGAPAQIGIRATDHTVPKDEEKIVLRFALQGDLPVGRYELAVLFDGKRATSAPFEVTASVPPLRVASPIALAGSLKTGTEWTYAFQALREPSPGIRLSLPEIKDADPDGWLRTTFTRKVVGADNDGISIESYRNGSLVLTGWIVPTVQGIANSRLKSSDDDYRLQPLDIFVAMPDKNFHKSWQTHDKTGTASDHQYEMWGPLPIKTADGEKPGYVVIQKEPNPKQKSVIGATAAYEIVPDVGLVREVDSRIAPSGQTISRIELTLTAMHAGSGDEPQLRSLTVPAPPANQPSGAQNERANQQQILNDLLR